MRVALLVLIAACGRVGFDARGDGGGGSDASSGDGSASALLAHYPCDALMGGVLPDVSGNGHDGTCTTCPTIALGKHAGACMFTGNGLVSIPSFTMDSFAVALWLNLQPPAAAADCPINRGFDTAATTNNSWQLCFKSDNTWFMGIGTANHYASAVYPYNAWHHVVIDWNGSQSRIFLDGAMTYIGTASPTAYDGSPITLGGDIDNGAPAAPTVGMVDDVYIYNRPLTPTELATLSAP